MKNDVPELSIVIPCYKCEQSLHILYERIVQTLEKTVDSFEIIFVNDASPEKDWDVISSLANNDKRVIGINFSRNFGQHYAITAGLDYTRGNWIVVMDGDLQDQPEEIPKLYAKALEGFDVVWARRKNRCDSFFKKTRAYLFFKVFDFLADTKTDPYTNTFSICKKVVNENYKQLKEVNKSFTLFIKWLGFKQCIIDVEHTKRVHGETSYTMRKLIELSANYIIIYSNKPLELSIRLGIILTFASFLFSVYLIYKKLNYGVSVDGWVSIMTAIFFLGGILIANLGIVGLYLGKVFNEVKNRPVYIIKEKLNVQK